MMDAHDLHYEGDAARKWLRELSGSLRPTWKFIELQWFPQTRQHMQDKTGKRQLYSIPPRFLLIYYRTRFRFFGGMQRATVEFAESDVYSVSFSRSRAISFWEAYYCTLRITLTRASIELTYSPALSGVTPIACARRSEDMRIDFGLQLKPEKT
jgi:hypothetical protein